MKSFACRRFSLLLACLAIVACERERSGEVDDPAVNEPSPGAAIAQQVPDSEIFVGRLGWQEGKPQVSEIRNITGRAGYDNQPQFNRTGNQLYFTSIREDEQADIYRYLLSEQQIVPFTTTPESEYSPTVLPFGDGISVVRVEKDGTQRLWAFPAANAEPQLVLESVRAIGYHAWLSREKLALFIVADPVRLEVATIDTEETRTVTTNVGRSLARIPGDDALAFVDKQDPDTWRVVRYDLGDGSLAELIDTPKGSEDFAWAANGGLFMGDEARLLYWDGHVGGDWQAVLDLSNTFGGRITRIAVSPGMEHIAFVLDIPEPG